MAKRRGRNEGKIFQRKDGRWVAKVRLESGQRKQLYGKTRREVADKLTVALKSIQDGMPISSGRQTTGQYLDQWLENIKSKVRPSTWSRYEQYVRIHMIPVFGAVSLSRLTPAHLERLYSERLAAGSSARTVHHVHTVLHGALEQAYRWGLVPRNVATLVDPPRTTRAPMHTLTVEQVRALLTEIDGEPSEALITVAVTTGMRLGELLALKWSEVDLQNANLRVVASLSRSGGAWLLHEPKTDSSRRKIELAGVTVSSLRRHRISQSTERLHIGPSWVDNDFVFTNAIGNPLDGTNVLRRWLRPALRQAGLPQIRFHELRHTAATLMLEQDAHPKVVSEMLGHSQISITLDLYSHVSPTMQKKVAAIMDKALA